MWQPPLWSPAGHAHMAQEYVELETCYIDTLERAAAAVAAGQTPPAGTSEFGARNVATSGHVGLDCVC